MTRSTKARLLSLGCGLCIVSAIRILYLKFPHQDISSPTYAVERSEGPRRRLLDTSAGNDNSLPGETTTDLSTTSFPDNITATNLTTADQCLPPAIDQFPRDVFTLAQLQDGALVLHVLGVVYMFVALAIACDDYFVPSLELICDVFRMNPDVAGATLMAAGSSAPELATAVIGVFVAQDDIGLSAVVGSAVFNILFVIGICGVFAGPGVKLMCWPIARDCVYYALSVLILTIIIYDEEVQLAEAIGLLVLYLFYIITMYFNDALKVGFHRFCCCLCCERLVACCRDDSEDGKGKASAITNNSVEYHPVDSSTDGDEEEELTESAKIVRYKKPNGDDSGRGSHGSMYTGSSSHSTGPPSPAGPEVIEDDEPTTISFPRQGSCWQIFKWAVLLPLALPMYLTVPDCRRRRWRRWIIITFINSCIWIGAFSYLTVWLITTIGYVLHISDDIMSITFLAAGVSIPDAIASLLVVKQGEGDMAVSNAIGSNVFDIVICLGLPWLLSTAIYGKSVKVYSKGLTYTTVTLFSTVIILLVATAANGWKLNKKYGFILLFLYLVFMALAVLYQLNVFGAGFSTPTCQSINL